MAMATGWERPGLRLVTDAVEVGRWRCSRSPAAAARLETLRTMAMLLLLQSISLLQNPLAVGPACRFCVPAARFAVVAAGAVVETRRHFGQGLCWHWELKQSFAASSAAAAAAVAAVAKDDAGVEAGQMSS